MAILDNFAKNLLKRGIFRNEMQKEVDLAIARARKGWADETSQVIKNVVTDSIQKKRYIATTAGRSLASKRGFEAKELPSGKVFPTLYRLYSDAPGAVQCVDRIRDSVLGGGYVLERVKGKKGSKQELKKLIAFFDNPNREGETIEDIVGGGVVNYLIYGNWYIEKVPTKRGKEIAEIYNLDSSKITILVDDDKHKQGVDMKMGYQRLTEFSKKVIYLPEDIIHVKRSSPTGSIYGQAVLETNTSTLMLLLNALTYNINVIKNGGVPSLQINLPDDSTETDAESVTRFYETNFGGPWNAGKPMVTYKGAKASALGITPSEMRYLELLEYGVRSITGTFGVPLILIGIPDGTNRACYSSDTEVLTENGWKLHQAVSKNEKIAVYDTKIDAIRFENPIKLLSYLVKEELVHFKNVKGSDILVTENHKMWYKCNAKKYQAAKASEVIKLSGFTLLSAPANFIAEKYNKKEIIIPAVYHQNHKKNEKDTLVNIDDFLAFMGLYLSEGGLFVKGSKKHNYVITFAQSDNVNAGKADKIDELLMSLPFTVRRNAKSTKDNCRRWSLHSKNLWIYLIVNVGGYCDEKHIPREFMSMPSEKLRILFDWMMLGDGSADNRTGRTSMSYSTTSKQLADDMQEIAFKLGYNTKITSHQDKRGGNRVRSYRVLMSTGREKHFNRSAGSYAKRVPYEGMVHCFSVSTGFYVTRRNGCVSLQGNTASSTVKAFYLNKIYPLRKHIANKLTQDIIVDGFGIDGWKLDFRSSGLEESDSTRRDVVVGFTKGLYSYNETRVKLGLLPIEADWANKQYLLGSKNDSLIDIEIAMENGKKPPEEANPDASQPQNKPNRGQGEGADDSDT